jgi:hypothetical protein
VSTPLFPHRRRRHLRCHFPVPVVVVPATSPCRPWSCCTPFSPCEQLLATAVGDPVAVIVVTAVLGHRTVGGGRRPSFCCRLLPRCCCRCWCARFLPWERCSPSPPREQCSQRRLAVVVLFFHPRSTLLTVAMGVVGFSLSFSSCTPFPPREQLLVAAVRGAVVVLDRPRRSSSCCPPCEQGLVAVVWA